MKVAVCLVGKIGSKSDKHGYGGNSVDVLKLGHKHYKQHLFDNNDVDVFCHSSSTELSEEIISLYDPKSYIFMEEPNFNIPKYVTGNNDRKIAHYHKWFSHKKVMELRKQYEIKTNIKYDFVYIGRYDIGWLTSINFSNFDPSYFYLTNWNRLFYKKNNKEIKGADWYKLISSKKEQLIKNNLIPYHIESKLVGYPYNTEGVMDSWFFSNSKYMDILCTLYDHLNEYTKPGTTWMSGKSTVVDSSGTISNHRLIPKHLENYNLLEKLKPVFYTHDDYPLIRRYYFNSYK